jgi:hypothetical protein
MTFAILYGGDQGRPPFSGRRGEKISLGEHMTL